MSSRLGNFIGGRAKVFKKVRETKNGGTFTTYTIGFSKKNQEGGYENAYLNAKFRKGVELENMADIEVNEAWLSFDKYESAGKMMTSWYVFISDFDIEDSEPAVPETPTEPAEPDYDKAFNATDDVIPF